MHILLVYEVIEDKALGERVATAMQSILQGHYWTRAFEGAYVVRIDAADGPTADKERRALSEQMADYLSREKDGSRVGYIITPAMPNGTAYYGYLDGQVWSEINRASGLEMTES